MSPVSGELIGKVDSKTAKTGDSVVVQTKTSVKTADGTEIPKGSKLVGHVMASRASVGGENSQVALQFDHVELKGGQSVPVAHSEIESISPAGGASTGGSAVSAPSASVLPARVRMRVMVMAARAVRRKPQAAMLRQHQRRGPS
jgi:hypothetical protein